MRYQKRRRNSLTHGGIELSESPAGRISREEREELLDLLAGEDDVAEDDGDAEERVRELVIEPDEEELVVGGPDGSSSRIQID